VESVITWDTHAAVVWPNCQIQVWKILVYHNPPQKFSDTRLKANNDIRTVKVDLVLYICQIDLREKEKPAVLQRACIIVTSAGKKMIGCQLVKGRWKTTVHITVMYYSNSNILHIVVPTFVYTYQNVARRHIYQYNQSKN